MENDDASMNATAVVKRNGYNECCSDDISGYSDENSSVKSSKEKTPMCLINDLARFNKISFQYRLTGEKGPAHCKQFTVTLELGDEVYTAEGFKIKKAQHLAAKEAIQKTKYKHPVPKVNRRNDEQGSSRANVTPTVELNAIAMKLGQQTFYIFDPRQMACPENIANGSFGPLPQPRYKYGPGHGTNGHMKSLLISEQTHIQSHLSFRGTFVPNVTNNSGFLRMHQGNHNRIPKYQQCYPVEAAPQHLNTNVLPACRITLMVGTQKFFGVGRTIQQAKHDAAAQAIVKLKEQIAGQQSEAVVDKPEENGHKSPISLVFEIGIKRNLPVDFKILREDGPAHMRKFITACIVGDIVTEGEGTGKKASKKKAAQKMIEELGKLPPLSPVNVPAKRVKSKTPAKKPQIPPLKNKNAIQQSKPQGEKYQKLECDYDNPVAKMLEWCQDNNYSEPVFTVIAERGKDRARRGQFIVEVTSNDVTAQGIGNSKKLAKRNSALNFLAAVGANPMGKTTDIATDIKHTEMRAKNTRKPENSCTSTEESTNVVDNQTYTKILKKPERKDNLPAAPVDVICPNSIETQPASEQTKRRNDTPAVANTANNNAVSVSERETNEKPHVPTASTAVKSKGFHMKDKLMYLAKLIGFEVDFSDYPKGNHNEFLTILMLSTNPPQICHGVGLNAEESQEDASKNALKILSEMGLNSSMK